MTLRVAINGYGRIGRNIMRALYESGLREKIELVAVNNTSSLATSAHLSRYDSTHGRFFGEVIEEEKGLRIEGDFIHFFSERDPENIPWKSLGIDVVFESTGCFLTQEKAEKHLKAGAKKVLISAPGGPGVHTVVRGVNEDKALSTESIVSNASCTTNCLAPVAKVLHDAFTLEFGMMTTVHSYTADQRLIDNSHKDLRRARAAGLSIIPTKTGAAAAVGLVLPDLAGKLEGYALRVPTANVSMIDLSFTCAASPSAEALNDVVKKAASDAMRGIIAYNEDPLVSIDFVHHPASAIFDATQTRVLGNLYKVAAWYDNEWGFSNRMLEMSLLMMQ